jgi:hypothetical protein
MVHGFERSTETPTMQNSQHKDTWDPAEGQYAKRRRVCAMSPKGKKKNKKRRM